MSTVESPPRDADEPPRDAGLGASDSPAEPRRARLIWGAAVGALLLFAFLLRIWGNGHGLPYAYNADENAHFVTRAIGLFGHDWDPNYYVNPPAYTYLVHLVLGVWYGGRAGVSNSFAADPTQIWIISRTIAALLGHDRRLAAVPRRRAARRPPRRPAGGGHLRGRLPAGLLRQARAQRRAHAGRRLPRPVGRGGHPAQRAHPGLRLGRAGPGPGLCDEVHGRDRAAADRRRGGRAVRRRRADVGAARDRHRRRRRARVVRRRQPLRAAGLLVLLGGRHAPVRGLRRRGRQARAHAGLRLRLLPVVLRLGAGLAAAALRRRRRGAPVVRRAPAAVDARAGDPRLLPVHGLPGALLRALAHAGLPVRLHPRRLRRDRARRLARVVLAGAAPDARGGGRRRCSAGRASSTRCTRASSCRATTRATSPATGWSPTSRRRRRSSSSPSCPTSGRRTSATRRRWRRTATAGTSSRSAARTSTPRRARR